MADPVWVQEDHRWVADDGGVNAGTLLGSGNNEDYSQDTADSNIRLRIVIKQTNTGKDINNQIFELRAVKNGGTWGVDDFQVTTTSTGVKLTNDTQSIADNSTTTQRIGDGTYETGGNTEGWNDGQTDPETGIMDGTGGEESEQEHCIQIVSTDSPSNGDYWEFKVYTSPVSTALDTYPATLPKIIYSAVVIESLVTAIDGSGLLVGLLSVQAPLATAITGSALVTADLERTRSLITDIISTALVTASQLDRERQLTTAINSSALIEPNLIAGATKALETDITGSVIIVVYDVIGNNTRATKQIIEVLANSTADVRATKQIIEVLANSTANVRATKQIIEVLAPAPKFLTTRIVSSALVTSDIITLVPLPIVSSSFLLQIYGRSIYKR